MPNREKNKYMITSESDEAAGINFEVFRTINSMYVQ